VNWIGWLKQAGD